jgi:uncharacterized protein
MVCLAIAAGKESGRGQPYSKTLTRPPTLQKSRSVCGLFCAAFGLSIAGKAEMREGRRVSIAELPIQIDRVKIAEFCRERGIRKLSLFGSVLRDDFDPQRSDVDVLAEFEPGTRPGLKFFGYGEELEAIIGHTVDFNTAAWLSRHFRDEVTREAVPIYEQSSRACATASATATTRWITPPCGTRCRMTCHRSWQQSSKCQPTWSRASNRHGPSGASARAIDKVGPP